MSRNDVLEIGEKSYIADNFEPNRQAEETLNLKAGAYNVTLSQEPILGGKKYLASVELLSEDDDRVGNVKDPITQQVFKEGQKVVRLTPADEEKGEVTYLPDSIKYLNPGVTEEDFEGITDGEIKED